MKKILFMVLVLLQVNTASAVTMEERTEQLCNEEGDALSCTNRGFDYYNGVIGTPQDYVKAKEYSTKGCNGGYSEACWITGLIYSRGLAIKKDYHNAAYFFKKSCDGGFGNGCRELALQYTAGQGVQQNYIGAKKAFINGCNYGDGESCLYLGVAYESGLFDTKQNYSKAINYYRESCNYKYGMGCTSLGHIYMNSNQGVAKDIFKAGDLYEKGCQYTKKVLDPNTSGCLFFGLLVEKGILGKENRYKAADYLLKACKSGDNEGCVHYNRLTR